MIKYRCEKDKVEVEGSMCPHCQGRAYAFSENYWCKQCETVSYYPVCEICGETLEKIFADGRIVFPQEKLLLEVMIQEQQKKEISLEKLSVWNGTGNIYYADGKRLPVSIGELSKLDINRVRAAYQKKCREKLSKYEKHFASEVEVFVMANHTHFQKMDKDAIDYIKEIGERFETKDMIISFSGGKDSTVVADLVHRALGDGQEKFLHIFGDTTLEFPTTYEYVKRYKATHQDPIVSSQNKDKNFFELCKEIGPPSRVMRWCCTIFKTGAIARKLERTSKSKSHVVTFYGIRRSESASRSKYEKESESPKIAKQTVISPIIDWNDFDVWLYLLTRKIDFNEAYRLGYARVGCFCCPNNSQWSEFLTQIHMPDLYGKFHEILIEFATKIGKPDPKEYVESGNWKARQGGNGVAMAQKSVISFTPCATEENSFNYQLQKPITEEFYQLFKPFGFLDFELGNQRLGEVYVLDKNKQPVLKLTGRIGKSELKVTIYNMKLAGARTLKGAEEKVKCQITKYQMCMGCLACEGVCKFDAITIKEIQGEIRYKIDEKKCVRCGHCVGHFIAGCYMRKVLAIPRRNQEE